MVNPLPQDNLEGDLRAAINDGLGDMGINHAVDYGPLLQRLVILTVARDGKIFNHAYQLGQMQATHIYKLSPRDSRRVLRGADNGQGIILKDKIEEE